jgi:glutamate 5-kinase
MQESEAGGVEMRLVVKVGTSTVHGRGSQPVAALAAEIAALVRAGHRVAVFSSGAVRAGREAGGAHLGAAAAAALGQPLVYARWQAALSRYGVTAAQVLVDDRHVHTGQAAAEVVDALWRAGAVPVLNGNDAVADARSPVGDNDALAAALALRLKADALVLLTDQDGLYTADPRLDPFARPIRRLTAAELGPMLATLATGRAGPHGRGGMASKARAAMTAARAGVRTVIADGAMPDVLAAILDGQGVGTTIEPVDGSWPPRVVFRARAVEEAYACGGQ